MRHQIQSRQIIDASHVRAVIHPACHVYKMVPEDVIYDDEVLDGNRVAVSTGLVQAMGANVSIIQPGTTVAGLDFATSFQNGIHPIICD